jgi:hypothetical protein
VFKSAEKIVREPVLGSKPSAILREAIFSQLKQHQSGPAPASPQGQPPTGQPRQKRRSQKGTAHCGNWISPDPDLLQQVLCPMWVLFYGSFAQYFSIKGTFRVPGISS